MTHNDNLKLIEASAIILSPSDLLTLKLLQNPTTGYTWLYDDQGEDVTDGRAVYRVVEDYYIADPVPAAGYTGSGGIRYITLEAVQLGIKDIGFVYAQPWVYPGFKEGVDPAT